MNQRHLFDKNPNLLILRKSAISRTTGEMKHLPFQYLGPPILSHSRTNDLYENIKPLVVLGRIIMIIPCSTSNYSTYKQRKLSISLLPVLCSILLSVWCFIQVIFGIKSLASGGATGRLGVMGYLILAIPYVYAFMEFLIYTYFVRRSDKLYRIFDKWSELAVKIDLEEDKFLKYLAYLLVAALFPPLIAYGCFMADSFHTHKDTNASSADSALQRVFETLLVAWKDVIPYSPYFVIAHTVLRFWTASSRAFVPLLVIFFSRAISFQFRKIIETATKSSDVSEAHYADMRNKGKAFWLNLVRRHQGMVSLLRTVNHFMSPLIFYWVVLSIYRLSTLFFRLLDGHQSLEIHTHTFAIILGVELTMFVATIISSSEVNRNAEKILIVLRNCPKEDFYETEVCRLEHQIATGPTIGFSGMGCFVITKPFLIKVFNAVFTMVIIMLQSVPNNAGG